MSRFVYFIQAGEDGPIKIGVATEPFKRLAELQTGNPARLRIVAIVEGDTGMERALHDRFAEHRLEGEWFKPTHILVALHAIRSSANYPTKNPILPATKVNNRPIGCDYCGEEIKPGTNGAGEYGGLLTWRLHGNGKQGGFSFKIVHKSMNGHDCDRGDDRFSMELDIAVGPHGLATLINFMAEPDTDRYGLQKIIYQLYLTDGELAPPATAFDPRCKDKFYGRQY